MRPLCVLLVLLCGCATNDEPAINLSAPPTPTTVWSVDLVRTLPGAQRDYLASIEANWAQARHLAREQGAVVSYRALAAEPDTSRGWDVLLMTEYADSAAWADRETIFQAIFASPAFVAIEPARPSAEMRAFEAGGVVLRDVVAVE